MPWRKVEESLAEWRAAERRLAGLPAENGELHSARQEVRAAKAAYEAAVAEAMLIDPRRGRDELGEATA
jgi:hypothetical protein